MDLRSPFISALTCVAALACVEAREHPNADSAESSSQATPALPQVSPAGSFAFADETGGRLLSLDTNATPQSFTAAVCGGGRYHVRYIGFQNARPDTSRRSRAADFANQDGQLFQLQGQTAAPGETCFVTSTALADHVAMPVRSIKPAVCSDNSVAALARIAGREVLNCWQLAEISGGMHYLAAHFANADTTALAALALVQDSVRLYYPLVGRYVKPGEDVWRVDDGGVFDPESIRLLFIARLPQGHAAAILWGGAEGELAQLVVSDSTLQARVVASGYRYGGY